MSKGWKFEPSRHALASRGIKTVSDFIELENKYDYDPSKNDDFYYRAIPVRLDEDIVVPKKSPKEAVDDEGDLVVDFMNNTPIYHKESSKSSCFSESIGGAVIGAMTGETGFNKGTFYIYRTDAKKPEVDLSDYSMDDFEVIDEVRFERPVDVEYVGKINIDSEDLKYISRCYRHEITEDEVKDVVGEMKKQGYSNEEIEGMKRRQLVAGNYDESVNSGRLKIYRNAISNEVLNDD